ncbi:MAG: hypothetical protein KBS70_03675 [Bacteroidales bacterium]|nr:hypothetical protein [Candidatus Colicola equi]
MKHLTLIIGVLLLVLNFVIGLIVSAYDTFNMSVNSGVILITTIFIWLLYKMALRDAYRISLTLLFVVIGIIQFVIGCFMPQQFHDNWVLLIEILCFGFEVLMIIVTNFISNKIKK